MFKNIERNYLYITYNPILALALFLEYMIQIIKRKKLFTNINKFDFIIDFNVFDAQCKVIVKKIKIMGSIIIEYLPFESVEHVFMEKDFKNRTVLEIITSNDIKTFIVKAKLRFLLDKIWEGKDSNLIDGKISHFSKTYYLYKHKTKSLVGAQIDLKDLTGSKFKPSINNFNFIY